MHVRQDGMHITVVYSAFGLAKGLGALGCRETICISQRH